MKILIVNASFYPVINGHVIYMENIAKAFIRQGHKVELLCSGIEEKEEEFKGIKLIRYKKPESELNGRESYAEYKKRSFERLKKLDICQKSNHTFQGVASSCLDFSPVSPNPNKSEGFGDYKKYDLIISGSEIFLEDLKKLYSSDKIIWAVPSLRNIAENVAENNEAERLKKEIKKAIEGIKLVVVSKSLKNQFKEYFGREDNIKVVYPGIDLDKFRFKENKSENNILFIGRICKEKNVEALIEGFKLTQKGNLIIVGGGEINKLKDKLKRSEKENKVFFEGIQKETKQYYDKSKIFVLPSIYESFGHVILEAMASGLVVIAFKPDGKKIRTASDEIIENGKNGFLVRDEKEMAEKIDLILKDEGLRKQIVQEARKQVEKYSWDKTAEEILNLLKTRLYK